MGGADDRWPDAVARVRAGTGGAVVVDGAAGTGKSAALAALADVAGSAGLDVLLARATRADATRAFGCLVDVLDVRRNHPDPRHRRVADALVEAVELTHPPHGVAGRLAVQEAIVDLLRERAQERPMVVALDDAHLADDATVGVLRALVRSVAREPLLVVWTVRTPSVPDALVDLRVRAGGLVTHVELMGASVDAAVLRALPRATADLVAVAAVIGPSFDVPTMVALTERAPTAILATLAPAVDAGVLRPGRLGAFAFTTVDAHSAFLADVPASLQAAVQRDLGFALAARGADPRDVARHLAGGVRVGDDVAAAMLVEAAASFGGRDPEGAAHVLGDAMRGATEGSPVWATAVVARLDALVRAGRFDSARGVAADARRVAMSPDTEAAVRRVAAYVDAVEGAPTAAAAQLRDLVDEPALGAAARAATLVALAWLIVLDDEAGATRLVDEAVACVGDAGFGDATVEADAHAVRALAASRVDAHLDAIAHARRAVTAARAAGIVGDRSEAVLVAVLQGAGATEEAARWAGATSEPALMVDPVLGRLAGASIAGEPTEAPTPLPARRGTPVVLTAKEREVAALVAEGFTNGAIAEQLGVSRRTVEYHMANLYAKVGVATRTALAAAVRTGHLR